MKSLVVCILILISFISQAEEFPANIFTAEYYYTFFISNLKYKLEKLHDQFPNRKLTSYWQYAVNDRCDTFYSHAIIPQVITSSDKLSILLNLTECGTPVKWFRFEYTLTNKKFSPQEIQQIKVDLIKFQLPAVDWAKFQSIQIATEDNYFFWNEKALFVRNTNDYSTYQVKLSHSHYILNDIKQNQLKLEFEKIKNDHQVSSKVLMISYQPASADHFPQIQYYDDMGSQISAKTFISDYRHYFTSTLNELILELSDITPQAFGVITPLN
jgi:hypothetical protein